MSKDTITEREKELLEYIKTFQGLEGYSPTIREIARGLNTKSLSHVQGMIDHLQSEGYLRVKPKRVRTIKILKDL